MIRILIVADSTARAQSMADLFSEDERFEVVGMRTRNNLHRPVSSFIDVVIAAATPVDQLPTDNAIILVGSERDVDLQDERVRALLPVDASPGELIAAVIAAAADLIVLTRAQAKRWLPGSRTRRQDRESPLESLTARELEVLRMLANGLGNKEIATQLAISDHTVKFHVAQILAKLAATSRTDAVMIAIRRGLIPI